MEEGLVISQRKAHLLCQIMRFGSTLLGHGCKALRADCCQIDSNLHRTEGFIGADIGRCFFSADVLFTRLQCQNKGPLSIPVHRLTDNPAGKLAHHLGTGGHIANVRTTKGHRQSQRLRLAHGNIRTIFRRCLQNTQRHRVAAHDQLSTSFMYQLLQRLNLLQYAEEVGLLHQEAGRFLIQKTL